MEYRTLSYERDEHVVVLTYDRPEQRNAVSREMNDELHHAWRRFRDDPEAFVLVITGAGDAFCAGWDLQDAAEWPRPDWDEFRTHIYDSDGVCGYTRRADVFKPVIAAVNGWAVAAGLENALLADIRIVAENAVFGALERRWNIVAGDGMTVRLPLVVGWAKAMEVIITGRAVTAEEALRIGLANEVVPEGESLQRALELAREVAALPQGATRTDKETMVRNLGRTSRSVCAKRPRPACRCSGVATRTRSAPPPSSRAGCRSGRTTGCRAAGRRHFWRDGDAVGAPRVVDNPSGSGVRSMKRQGAAPNCTRAQQRSRPTRATTIGR